MSFKLVEKYVQSKSLQNDLPEDMIFHNENFFAVIDGATTKTLNVNNFKEPGRKIAEIAIETLSALPGEIEFPNALLAINEQIRTFFNYDCHNNTLPSIERASASIAIISVKRDEIWVLGDCQALVDGKKYQWPKLIDQVNGMYRALVNQVALASNKSIGWLKENDIGREAILETLKKQSLFQNTPNKSTFSYGALDGSNEAIKYINIIDISNAEEVVIASDGYPKLFTTLEDTEKYLTYILENDPMMIFDIMQTKGMTKGNVSYDDRAYIRIKRN